MRWASAIAGWGMLTLAGFVLVGAAPAPPAPAPKAPASKAEAAPPAKPPGVELRGRVTGDGGQALAHAVVRVAPVTAKKVKPTQVETGADGGFVVQGLSGASFRVRVEAKGYAAVNENEIPAGATVNLRLKRGFPLSGIVLDRATRKPIEGATIAAREIGAEVWGDDADRKATAAKDGRFSVADLPSGKVTIEARASGHAATKMTRVVGSKAPQPPSTAAVEILLDPAGTLSGQVTDTVDNPVAGAEVTAYWRDATGEHSKKGNSDAAGHYGISGAGELRITRMTVSAKGFPPQDRPGGVPSDGVVDFILEHGGTIAGEVKSSDGKSVPAYHLVARRERADDDPAPRGGSKPPDRDFSDPSGAFRIEDVDPGTYTVEIQCKGFATIKKAGVEVRPEQVADLGTLTLESSSSLRGRVVYGGDQAPVSAASIRVSLVEAAAAGAQTATNLWNANSGSDGTFVFPNLAKGTYDLTAEHSSFAPVQMRVSFDPSGDSPEIVVTMFHGGSLGGTVIDGQAQPVAGVRILATLGAQSDARVADTGSDGHYFIDGLTPGTYQVTRQPRDGAPASGNNAKVAAIREGETTTVDFDEGPRIQMSGVVRKGEEPLANTSIYLFAVDNNAVPLRAKKAQTDGSGAYQVGLDQSGRYQASVRINTSGGPGGQNVVLLNVPDQAEVHQDIIFAVNAIEGHVQNPEGGDVKGAIILAMQDSAGASTLRQSTTTTGADGMFRLDAVEPGTYRVSARATGYAPGEQYPVVVGDDQPEARVDLTLERGWLMHGHVTDPDGRPVNDATIVVASPGNAESGFLPSHTDATGAFRITSSVDGPVNVAAISPRFAPAVKTDIQPPSDDDPPEVDLHATVGGTLRIRVVHRGGGPVAGASTAIRPVPLFPGADLVMDRNRPKPTDADGMSVVPRLYPGGYVVALVGRSDATPVQATVGEGTESQIVIEVP